MSQKKFSLEIFKTVKMFLKIAVIKLLFDYSFLGNFHSKFGLI